MRAQALRLARGMFFFVASATLIHGQATETVLHSFTGFGADGYPYAPVTFAPDGTLYGTTSTTNATGCGFSGVCGTVYQLSSATQGRKYEVIATFYDDFWSYFGGFPVAGITLDSQGNLYTSLSQGGFSFDRCIEDPFGCGMIVALVPRADRGARVRYLYDFVGPDDGARPSTGVIFDEAGNLYGTASSWGPGLNGVVFQLKPGLPRWQYNVVHAFDGKNGGAPASTPVFDRDGSLYGTALVSSRGGGLIYQLSPRPDGSWSYTQLYNFSGGADGGSPKGDLVLDAAGNLYGSTQTGGDLSACNGIGCGTVFQLSQQSGQWKQRTIYRFTGADGANPVAGLVLDSAGNLYGTTQFGGAFGSGTIFELSPSGNLWNQTVLYSFSCGNDGGMPSAKLTLDTTGNLYGTTLLGGSSNFGVIFELNSSDAQ
jgi:uncharacterized repeat protein (TIGR03803 family)